MQIEMISVDKLMPYANNPRKNDKAVKAVADSIKQFGFNVPITIDKNGVIITGHTRLKAAIRLKMSEVPCIRLESLSEDQIKAFRLVDNKVAEISEWDIDALMKELSEVNIDLTDFGFEKQKTLSDVEDDDYEIKLPKDPISKPGDIYQLGSHRLICGDATNIGVIERLMDIDLADCMITDPPYNIDYSGGGGGLTQKREKILNDHMSDGEFSEFLEKAFTAASAFMKQGAGFYIWHADKETLNFREACEKADFEVKQTLIWNKSTFTLGRQDYQWKHEPCLYGWKRGAGHYFINDRTWTTIYENEETLNIDKMKIQELRDLLKRVLGIENDGVPTTVMDADKPSRSEEHPTMKPIKLIAKQMNNSSKPGDIVLDTFGGSGTTLIVAEQLGRKCCMAELDPKYVDVIIDRWQKYTGQTARKIG